jgi:hypothetical protein
MFGDTRAANQFDDADRAEYRKEYENTAPAFKAQELAKARLAKDHNRAAGIIEEAAIKGQTDDLFNALDAYIKAQVPLERDALLREFGDITEVVDDEQRARASAHAMGGSVTAGGVVEGDYAARMMPVLGRHNFAKGYYGQAMAVDARADGSVHIRRQGGNGIDPTQIKKEEDAVNAAMVDFNSKNPTASPAEIAEARTNAENNSINAMQGANGYRGSSRDIAGDAKTDNWLRSKRPSASLLQAIERGKLDEVVDLHMGFLHQSVKSALKASLTDPDKAKASENRRVIEAAFQANHDAKLHDDAFNPDNFPGVDLTEQNKNAAAARVKSQQRGQAFIGRILS